MRHACNCSDQRLRSPTHSLGSNAGLVRARETILRPSAIGCNSITSRVDRAPQPAKLAVTTGGQPTSTRSNRGAHHASSASAPLNGDISAPGTHLAFCSPACSQAPQGSPSQCSAPNPWFDLGLGRVQQQSRLGRWAGSSPTGSTCSCGFHQAWQPPQRQRWMHSSMQKRCAALCLRSCLMARRAHTAAAVPDLMLELDQRGAWQG